MKKVGLFTLILVFGVAAAAMAGFMDKLSLPSTGETVELKLADLSPDLASYAGGDFDPTKAKKYTYTTYKDDQWDGLAKSVATASLAVDFADLVVKSEKSTKDDLAAVGKALEPVAKDLPAVKDKVVAFIGSVKSDPKKVLMLKDAKSVSDQAIALIAKLPAVLDGVKNKAASQASDVTK